jgi:hypothetical protein
MKEMLIVSQINTQQELNEMKTVMEIFVVNTRIRQLARLA